MEGSYHIIGSTHLCKGVILIIVSGSLENYTIVVAKDESYAKSTLISNATDKPSLLC